MISSFKMALRSIGSNKMRAALTMLGIIIGVMALVVLVSLVNGATNTVTDEVSSLGSNYVDAYVWRQEVGSSLTINDLRKWAQENEYVEAVAPVNTGDAKGKAGSSSDSISLYGTMPAYADINGLTLLGGEPFEPENQRGLLPFLRRVRERLPGKTIWAFTGFTWEQLHTDGSHPRCEVTDELLSLVDVLVDGRFVEELHDISLRFRGSSNQRIIDVPRTLSSGGITLWEDQ